MPTVHRRHRPHRTQVTFPLQRLANRSVIVTSMKTPKRALTGKRVASRLVAVLSLLGCLLGLSAWDSWAGSRWLGGPLLVACVPEIGKPLPFKADPQYEITMSTSRKDAAYFIRVGEIEYSLAVDDKGLVSYLSTSHPEFRTPEGLRVGSSLDEARAAGAGEFAPEHGWACFAKLPSGWWAASLLAGAPQTCDPRIALFFKGWR